MTSGSGAWWTSVPASRATPDAMALRRYQEQALHDVGEHFNAGARSVCLVMPTGAGKTRTGVAWLTGDSGIRGAPVRHQEAGLWVVHRIELARQALEHLGTILPGEVAVIRSGTDATQVLGRAPRVYVTTIQSLLASGQRPPVERIILDEAHHFIADEWSKLLSAYPTTKVLGLTATPERKDGRALGDIFERLVVGARYPDLVDAGHLVRCRAFAPPEAVDRGVANDPVAMYQKHGEGSQGFLFSGSIDSAEMWAARFSDAGISAFAVHQRVPAGQRRRALADFTAGRIRILTNVYVLTEGVDVPAARVCILARAVPHVGNYLQMAGRVLRPAPGKPDAILLDLCGSVLEHGLPTEDRTYSLDGRAISRTVASVRQCPQCGAVHDGAPPTCDLCGYVFPTAAQEAPPPPRIYDMELREVYAGGATPEPARKREFDRLVGVATDRDYSLSWVVKQYQALFHEPPTAWLAELPEEAKRREYDKLATLQRERGYRPGFVAVRWKELFGAWPPRAWTQAAVAPVAPTALPSFIPWLTKQGDYLAGVVHECLETGCLQRRIDQSDRSVSEAAIIREHLDIDHEWGYGDAAFDNLDCAIENYKRTFVPGYTLESPPEPNFAPTGTDDDVPF